MNKTINLSVFSSSNNVTVMFNCSTQKLPVVQFASRDNEGKTYIQNVPVFFIDSPDITGTYVGLIANTHGLEGFLTIIF